MVKYIIDKENISTGRLTEFVKSVDKDFHPPLSGRVDIEEWVKKIYEKGTMVIAEMNKTYIGCILFYANDEVNRKGYIAYLAVDPLYRGLGVAKTMLDNCMVVSKEKGMISMNVYTNSSSALKLYMGKGFNVECEKYVEEYNVTSTFLTKSL